MQPRYFDFWPKGVPQQLALPETTIYYNLEVSATRYPRKQAISYYGAALSYAELKIQADHLAGFLQTNCAVRKGDRVILYMQNSPQFVIAYYAILRADAVVVPVNPMNLTDELKHYVSDSGARVAICGQELFPRIGPLLGQGIEKIIVANYGEYVADQSDPSVPDFIRMQTQNPNIAGVTMWRDALAAGRVPAPWLAQPDDMCAMPYTSGTTGKPKGCMHTHRTLMATASLYGVWSGGTPEDSSLAVVPFFHITGMQVLMNAPIYIGSKMVIMTRWDRELAAKLIAKEKVTSWTNIPTMVIDMLGSPNVGNFDFKSLRHIGGGGAAMPEAVAKRLFELTGLKYVEGYGLTETAAPTHSNPADNPKRQCL
ncbi:MAG: AMP-binding protein, partial [Burkholderiales bacterium]